MAINKGKIRQFETGATRDTEEGKNDYEINWEWLGGFFDGEGYAGFQKANTYILYRKRKDGTRTKKPYISKPRIDVSIAQKDLDILKKIKDFIGYGYVIKSSFTWACNSAKGRKFLVAILPYLKTEHKIYQVLNVLKKDKETIKPRRRKK